MKKTLLVPVLLAALAGSAAAQEAQSGAAQAAPSVDTAKFRMAISQEKRKLFGAGMNYLSAEKLQTFWAIYADFEKEQDAITAARLDIVRRYLQNVDSLTDAQITSLVTDSADAQKKTTELRMKYFGIYSQKIDVRAAGHFALIDDFVTTALRVQLLSQLPIPVEGAK